MVWKTTLTARQRELLNRSMRFWFMACQGLEREIPVFNQIDEYVIV